MSTHWLDRARLEIPQSTGEGTADTAERNLTTVMAVPQPGKSEISQADETRIRAWLLHIGETHQPIIDDVMQMIANDPVALAYYLKRSDEVPHSNQPEAQHD
ncbi:MAG: hypothetical protein HY273_14695 [Gammaproteobacteria bacterium]|nr:hypothetical protein [Gammaproteobacteria bacterium]